jgi:rSAM/selenodomain-associated transferase 2
MSLSVIIPALQEADLIGEAVTAAAAIGDEVVVVDGQSTDGTGERARAAGARVLSAARGRGGQLHAGAQAARGDVLLFLHADVRLPPEARPAVLAALADPAVPGGNFHLRFEPATRAARAFTWANDLRRRLMRIYYGDSALFLRRAAYERLGGFRPLPLFEDYELVRRMERLGRTAYVRTVSAVASSRRFARRPLRTVLIWTLLQVLYSGGVSAARLAPLYRDLRQ